MEMWCPEGLCVKNRNTSSNTGLSLSGIFLVLHTVGPQEMLTNTPLMRGVCERSQMTSGHTHAHLSLSALRVWSCFFLSSCAADRTRTVVTVTSPRKCVMGGVTGSGSDSLRQSCGHTAE